MVVLGSEKWIYHFIIPHQMFGNLIKSIVSSAVAMRLMPPSALTMRLMFPSALTMKMMISSALTTDNENDVAKFGWKNGKI